MINRTANQINKKTSTAEEFGQRFIEVESNKRWCITKAFYNYDREIWNFTLTLENTDLKIERTSVDLHNAKRKGILIRN